MALIEVSSHSKDYIDPQPPSTQPLVPGTNIIARFYAEIWAPAEDDQCCSKPVIEIRFSIEANPISQAWLDSLAGQQQQINAAKATAGPGITPPPPDLLYIQNTSKPGGAPDRQYLVKNSATNRYGFTYQIPLPSCPGGGSGSDPCSDRSVIAQCPEAIGTNDLDFFGPASSAASAAVVRVARARWQYLIRGKPNTPCQYDKPLALVRFF